MAVLVSERAERTVLSTAVIFLLVGAVAVARWFRGAPVAGAADRAHVSG